MKIIIKWLLTLSVLANVGLAIILFTPLTEAMHALLKTDDPPRQSEVIVVLSSAFSYPTKNGLPGLSTLVRLEKGLELYRQGLAPKIVVLGGIQIKNANKSIARAMQERLLLYGVPKEDIIVQDVIMGTWAYYDNLMDLLDRYKDRFDFNKAMFVTSSEQTFRIRHALKKRIPHPIIVTSEPYESVPDWGQRFQLFRRVANELLVAIPAFYFAGRF